MDFNYLNNFNNLLLDIDGKNKIQEEDHIINDDTSINDKTDFKNRTKPKYKHKTLDKIFVIPNKVKINIKIY